MSCQQLIQEDPYIFTDTTSNSSFMHENNSQTKYVPLNRQTIYNRQFRQHEPTISSTTDSNVTHQKSTTLSDQKIIINPNSLRENKKNGLNNGKTLTSSSSSSSSSSSTSSSPRTSPKFFKTHQQQNSSTNDDGRFLVNSSNSNSTVINHSIASVSKNQLQQKHNNTTFQLNHVAESNENSITGIKQEVSNDDYVNITHVVVNEIKVERKYSEEDRAEKFNAVNRMSLKKGKEGVNKLRSDNVIVEPIFSASVPLAAAAPLVQLEINVIDKRSFDRYRFNNCESKHLTRDERLNMRKIQLRHAANQYKGMNHILQNSTERFRFQFNKSCKLLKMLDRAKERIFKKPLSICNMRDCSVEAVTLSDYCAKHILSIEKTEKEQFLIRQCCFLYPDGQQCRVPVYDVLATVAVCNEHLNAPVNKLINSNSSGSISDSTKPKKPPVQRKRTKTKSPLIRPVKKNGKAGRKKKIPQSNIMVPRPTMIIHPSDLQSMKNSSSNNIITSSLSSSSSSSSLPLKQENIQHESNQFIHHNSGYLLASSQSSYGSMSSGNEDLYLKQDLMTAVCENSYESSEDTGVGGLSENELISHDVIGNFDMESCAELSKVLSSLPSNTLDDLLTEPLQTSRDDEEYLDRAIEEVSATGMDQIAITAFEHLEGLDMLEMLDDDEQRQMISAATNLISMSGYLHDQDNNYSAMPSPMMS